MIDFSVAQKSGKRRRTRIEQIGFRLPLSLKRELSEVANQEGRTLSQMCEIFVSLGLEAYQKDGHRYIEKFLARQKKTSPSV
jgi:hypothetical protein